MFSWLADVVVASHFLFLLFVVAGGVLAWRWPRVAWVHLPCATWGALIEIAGWVCPLTPLENWLRAQGGGERYASGFIEHYVVPVMYPTGLTRRMQLSLGAAVVAWNVLVYAMLYIRMRRRASARAEFDG